MTPDRAWARSFVRSVTMDAWSDKELEIMKVGGNPNMLAFWKAQGFPSNLSIQVRFNTWLPRGCLLCDARAPSPFASARASERCTFFRAAKIRLRGDAGVPRPHQGAGQRQGPACHSQGVLFSGSTCAGSVLALPLLPLIDSTTGCLVQIGYKAAAAFNASTIARRSEFDVVSG
jgi:hypothetical protein